MPRQGNCSIPPDPTEKHVSPNPGKLPEGHILWCDANPLRGESVGRAWLPLQTLEMHLAPPGDLTPLSLTPHSSVLPTGHSYSPLPPLCHPAPPRQVQWPKEVALRPGTTLWTLSINDNCPLNTCSGQDLPFSKACILTCILRGKLGCRGMNWFTKGRTPHSWMGQAGGDLCP